MSAIRYLLIAFLCLPGSGIAQTVTGKAVLKGLNVRDAEMRALENGEVVTKLASEYEQSKREMAIDATILIDKPLSVLLEESEDDVTLIPGKYILDSLEVTSEADFEGVGFDEDEGEEAAAWLKAGHNDKLNLGQRDLWIVNDVKSKRAGRSDIDVASEAVRKILRGRYHDYMTQGLQGIEPYVRKKKSVLAGHELKLSNEQLIGVEEYFPDYFDTLVSFPKSKECCEHRFMWVKAKVRGRPTFILIHRIVLATDEVALLTERHFYVSHSVNSLQMTLGWLPYTEGDDKTYLGIATSANSDYLTGFTGKLIRKLGANKGAKKVGDVLVDIREDLEAGRSIKESYDE